MTNISLDIAEGEYKDAAKRVVIEALSFGLSTAVKNNPDIDEAAEYILDTHIIIYEDLVVPLVQDNDGEEKSPEDEKK